jgi:LEA14-like dessication related protein
MRPLRAPLAALLLLSLAGCAGVQQMIGAAFEKPRLTYESFTPEELDLEGVTLKLRYRIDNPNAVGLKLATVDYRVDVENSQVVTGSSQTGLSVPARGSAPLDLPVRVRYADIPNFLSNLVHKDSLAFQFQGAAGLSTPVGVINLPFSYTGQVPTPKLPGIALTGVSVRGLSLDGVTLEVHLEVRNQNGFALPVGALAYGLRLGGSEVLSGANQAFASVPANGKNAVTIPVHLPFAAAADAVSRLMRGGATDLGLKGQASFGTVKLPVDLGGKVAR